MLVCRFAPQIETAVMFALPPRLQEKTFVKDVMIDGPRRCTPNGR